MTDTPYSMSFTSGGLLRHESVELASQYRELGDWTAVRKIVVEQNLLQARTLSTLKRICNEVVSRLRTLEPMEIELLVEGSHQEQACLLWVAVCRRYRFIAEFAVEVVRERFITSKTDLTPVEFDSFFDQKSEWYPELDVLTPATRSKLRQVLFRMLREADLITANGIINAAMLSPRVLKVIGDRKDLARFPVFEADLKGLV